MTRQAISPRLAISIFENTARSHAENAEAGAVMPLVDRRVERGGEAERQHVPRLRGIDDAVVPEPRAGVIGMALHLVLLPDRRFELIFRGGAPFGAACAHAVAPDGRQDRCGLLAAHH